MNILIVSQNYAPDITRGAERVAETLASSLSRKHDVSVLTLGDEAGTDSTLGYDVHRVKYMFAPRPKAQELQLKPIEKVLWHARNAVTGINSKDLSEVLAQVSPDVVYVHNSSGFQPQLYSACSKLGIPLVVHLHDYCTICPRTTMYRRGQNCTTPCTTCRLLTAAWRHASKSVGDAIAVSEFVRDRHRQHGAFPNARWHVVHNTDASTLEGFSPKVGGTFTFGFIGALTEAKGLSDLLHAFGELNPGTANLVIAGRGDETYLASLCKDGASTFVTWMGHVPPNELYSSIDCLVIPSRWHEPQALVVGEGLRRGLPIIASDRGGNTEVLRGMPLHHLYDPDEPGALARAMMSVMASPRKPEPRVLNDKITEQVEGILKSSIKSKKTHA